MPLARLGRSNFKNNIFKCTQRQRIERPRQIIPQFAGTLRITVQGETRGRNEGSINLIAIVT